MVFYGKISVFMGARMTQSEILFHGSLKIAEFPEIRTSRFHKDFYFGFYCTKLRPQAIRWAVRRSTRGILNPYRFMPNEMQRILCFDEMTDEWLDFIVACRSRQAHDFDIVEGLSQTIPYLIMCRTLRRGKFPVKRSGHWQNFGIRHTDQFPFGTGTGVALFCGI